MLPQTETAQRLRAVAPASARHVVSITGTASSLNDRAYRLQREGRHRQAEPLLREALRRNPNYAYAQYNLGWSLVEQGRAREAVAPLQRTAARQPGRWQPQYRLGQAYEQLANSTKPVPPTPAPARCEPRGRDGKGLRGWGRVRRRSRSRRRRRLFVRAPVLDKGRLRRRLRLRRRTRPQPLAQAGASSIVTRSIWIASVGLEGSPLREARTGTVAIASTTSWPAVTRPKIV